MRIIAIAASLLMLSTAIPVLCSSAEAQNFNKRARKGEGNGRRRQGEEENLDAPISNNKFPGVGSIDAWRTSVPEFREGMQKYRNHRWDEAIAHYRASLALYEYQPNTWYYIGKSIEAKGGLVADAEKAYRHCVKLENENWRGWQALSNVLYMQKRFDEAREAITSALAMDAPAKAKAEMRKMVVMIDSGQRNANTQSQNTSQ